MLHHLDNGKYLWSPWQEDRNKALDDRTDFNDEELNHLEVAFPDGDRRHDPDTWTVESRRGKKVDIRKKPEIGG